MPTYEYVCEGCGHHWEARQSMKDEPLRQCPSCQQPRARRQISLGGGFILKGGGWYADLYGSSSSKKTADGASSSTPTADGSDAAVPAASGDSASSAKGGGDSGGGSGSGGSDGGSGSD